MKPYRLDRFRSYDYGTLPVCGLPEGHSGDCMSEESLRRYREKRNAGRRERYIGQGRYMPGGSYGVTVSS